jgi:hypothetical protein
MIRVEGHSNLFRDEKSGAIINTDTVGYEQYLNTINNRISQRKEIEILKQDISEIKNLLKELINGSK